MTELLPVRPMPIGAFPLPFGYLLLEPWSAAVDEVRQLLLLGRLPRVWPEELRPHELALNGDPEGALEAIAGDSVVSRYNRFVLDPEGADTASLRRDLGTELAPLVDVVLFGLGLTDTPPPTQGCTGEILALVIATHAALAVDNEEFDRAALLLDKALDAANECYPALAGVLYGAAAQASRAANDVTAAIAALTAGLTVLADTDLAIGRAEQHLELGMIRHEQAAERRDRLAAAVSQYHNVLALISVDTAPELFAAAHANLASAYLTMPMVEASDQLRLGVAVGSLRAALTVYQQETHPQEWSSAQLNLANALVYAPSTHQADNLVEAVELYEAVLVSRNRHDDPLGYARVLANQGNALAHLGMFDHARGKLVEARFIFEEFGEYDATSSVRGLLDEIARSTSAADA